MTPTARFSAMHIGSPWRGVAVVPGADPAEARPAAMFLYSGLVVTVPVTPTQDYTALFRMPLRSLGVTARERSLTVVAPARPLDISAEPRRGR